MTSLSERLAVRRLELTDFRNYRHLRLNLPAGMLVLVGPNGAGKTNLLEALSLFSPGRGLRRATLRELTRFGAEGGWTLSMRLDRGGSEVRLGTGLAEVDGRAARVVRCDGEKQSTQQLVEVLGLQWLTPQMDRLFIEGAAPRRRYLDRMVLAFDSMHGRRVASYERGLRERAQLLRTGRGDPTWLKVLEERIAGEGVAIAAARRDAVSRLDSLLSSRPGPFPGAVLKARGTVENWLAEMPAVDAEARFQEQLRRQRGRSKDDAVGTDGPHRSDLAVYHARKGVPAGQCSTGEQKALLIAIQLATIELETRRRGAPPILLFDEIAAHLDEERRSALFDVLEASGAQVWMTGTDAALFKALRGRASFIQVQDGEVTFESPGNNRELEEDTRE